MSVWKEIRCDAVPSAADCLSNSNLGPKGFESAALLQAQARKEGWKFKGDEATCPHCAKADLN